VTIRQPLYTTFYLATFHVFIAMLFTLYLYIYLTPKDHSSTQIQVPIEVLSRSVPYECIDVHGSLSRCFQDDCRGAVLPPRSRHCKDCRRCRLEFDHCCPWLACITRDTIKPFIMFLALVPPTIGLGLWEAIPLALLQWALVKDAMWNAQHLYRIWWDRWYSWLGGPVFRLGGGVVLSFWFYTGSEHASSYSPHTPPPTITPFLYSVFGSLLALLTAFLLLHTLQNILFGTSTIETERQRIRKKLGVATTSVSDYVWMPLGSGTVGIDTTTDSPAKGRVVRLPHSEAKLYDFGRKQNWALLMGSSVVEWFGECGLLREVVTKGLTTHYI